MKLGRVSEGISVGDGILAAREKGLHVQVMYCLGSGALYRYQYLENGHYNLKFRANGIIPLNLSI